MKTLVIISDLHCGSIYGLTPKSYHQKQSPHHHQIQKEGWDAYCKMARDWEYPDCLLVNGDCIEGRQEKQGGAELLTNDRNIQSKMAVEAIERFHARKIIITFGSSYHVSDSAEDFEYNIADDLRAEVEGKIDIDIGGMVVNARHKIGISSVPQGRATALLRDMAWNLIRACEKDERRADILIRSHCHYHVWVEQPKRVMFTTPALQLSGGRYGSRECSGETHWGAIRLVIRKGQIEERNINIWRLKSNRTRIIKIR